jgi:hypothetical protein
LIDDQDTGSPTQLLDGGMDLPSRIGSPAAPKTSVTAAKTKPHR